MANNDQLIDQIRKVVREEVKIEVEPINKRLDSLVKGQTRLEQGQGRLETSVNAIAEAQKEIQETMATKADVLNIGVKVDKLRKRVESVEEDTDSTPRHKN